MSLFLIAPVAVIFVALITVLALSKKSIPPVRRAAIIALFLIALSLVVCLILISGTTGTVQGPIPLSSMEPAPAEKEGDFSAVVFIIFFLFFLAWIIFLALRKERRMAGK